jgi:hypothetical protein
MASTQPLDHRGPPVHTLLAQYIYDVTGLTVRVSYLLGAGILLVCHHMQTGSRQDETGAFLPAVERLKLTAHPHSIQSIECVEFYVPLSYDFRVRC